MTSGKICGSGDVGAAAARRRAGRSTRPDVAVGHRRRVDEVGDPAIAQVDRDRCRSASVAAGSPLVGSGDAQRRRAAGPRAPPPPPRRTARDLVELACAARRPAPSSRSRARVGEERSNSSSACVEVAASGTRTRRARGRARRRARSCVSQRVLGQERRAGGEVARAPRRRRSTPWPCFPASEVELGAARSCSACVGDQRGAAVELVDDVEDPLLDAPRAQCCDRSSRPICEVHRRPLVLGDERIGRLLDAVVEELVASVQAEDEPRADGLPEVRVRSSSSERPQTIARTCEPPRCSRGRRAASAPPGSRREAARACPTIRSTTLSVKPLARIFATSHRQAPRARGRTRSGAPRGAR